MKNRTNISSSAIWEDQIGYSRAVKIGRVVEVSGTSAIDRDKIIAPNDPYQQTHRLWHRLDELHHGARGTRPQRHGIGRRRPPTAADRQQATALAGASRPAGVPPRGQRRL